MRAYLVYKDKAAKGFRRIASTGGIDAFDKYKNLAIFFIKYATSDLDVKLAEYDQDLDLNSIQLEKVFPTNYKWLVSDASMKGARSYLDTLETRVDEFKGGKEDNLKMLVGYQLLRFALLTKLVENYLFTARNLKKVHGFDVSNLTLRDIGITKSILKYFDNLEILSNKSIDDWLGVKVDPAVAKHFYSSMKRILTILLGQDLK